MVSMLVSGKFHYHEIGKLIFSMNNFPCSYHWDGYSSGCIAY